MATEAQAQESASAASSTGADGSNIDIGEVTLEQLDKLMTTGSAELPVVDSGQGESGPGASGPGDAGATGATGPAETGPAASGETGAAETGETGAAETGETGAAQTGAVGEAETGATGATGPAIDDEEKDETRFRHRGSNRAINALFKAREAAGKAITWAEAERIVLGTDVSGPAAESTPTAVSTQLETQVGTLRTEVEGLRQQLNEAGENEGVFDKSLAKIVQDLAAKEADLRLAERDLREAKEDEADAIADENAQWTANSQKSKAVALEMYGEAGLGNEKTEFGKAVADRVIAMRNPKHPDHQILFAATAPETIAMKVASEMGIQPKKKAAAAATTTTTTPPPVIPPKSKVAPVTGAKSSAAAQPTKEDAQKQLEHLQSDNVTLKELDDLFEGPGGLRTALHAAAAR